jgi:sugar-specific transcriptional regulator TrmB
MDFSHWADKLRELGFTQNEAKVYLAMLARPPMTVAQIVRTSGVPRPKIYETARSLIQRGFAEELVGDVKSFRAVPPEVALPVYTRQTETKLRQDAAMLTALAQAVPSPAELAGDGWNVRLIHGPESVFSLVGELEQSSQEIIRFIRPPFLPSARPVRLATAYSDDIKFYGLIDRAAIDDATKGAEMRTAEMEDSRARVVESLPFKGVMFDRKTLVMPLGETMNGPTLLIPGSPMLESLAAWAINMWENASPFTPTTLKPNKQKETQ